MRAGSGDICFGKVASGVGRSYVTTETARRPVRVAVSYTLWVAQILMSAPPELLSGLSGAPNPCRGSRVKQTQRAELPPGKEFEK